MVFHPTSVHELSRILNVLPSRAHFEKYVLLFFLLFRRCFFSCLFVSSIEGVWPPAGIEAIRCKCVDFFSGGRLEMYVTEECLIG